MKLQWKNVEEETIAEEIYQIFDKTFKKVLTLSTKAVVNLINGMFGTDYPLDSTITYNWTEFEDDNLKKILADTILTIDGKYVYHLEAQMEKDNCIVFRVFEYGFGHANRTRIEEDGRHVLRFPRPIVIYLYYEGKVPDEYELKLEFEEGQGEYYYKVPVLKLPDISAKELSDRKMVVLIPFHILRLRYELQKGKVGDISKLKSYIMDDIIGHIDENKQLGNITVEDALKLKRYLQKLCDYLSDHLIELKEVEDMTDESYMTDIDIMCKEHEERVEKLEDTIVEKDKQIEAQSVLIEDQAKQIALLMNRVKQLEEK